LTRTLSQTQIDTASKALILSNQVKEGLLSRRRSFDFEQGGFEMFGTVLMCLLFFTPQTTVKPHKTDGYRVLMDIRAKYVKILSVSKTEIEARFTTPPTSRLVPIVDKTVADPKKYKIFSQNDEGVAKGKYVVTGFRYIKDNKTHSWEFPQFEEYWRKHPDRGWQIAYYEQDNGIFYLARYEGITYSPEKIEESYWESMRMGYFTGKITQVLGNLVQWARGDFKGEFTLAHDLKILGWQNEKQILINWQDLPNICACYGWLIMFDKNGKVLMLNHFPQGTHKPPCTLAKEVAAQK